MPFSLPYVLFPELKDNQKPGSAEEAELAEYHRYLQELSALSLEAIVQQPSILTEKQKVLRREMDDLAFKNYKVFIQSANTSQTIRTEMSNIGKKLNSLISHLPNLTTQCQDFCKTAQTIAKARQVNHKTLRQHTAILELLELPQLMDTCVKNNHFEEALELEQFAKRMHAQHPDIPIIDSILADVKASVATMQIQICQQLCSNVDLPVCLRAIGYLKRLRIFNDRELRVAFLHCRTAFLNDCLAQIPTANAYNHATKIIEVYRIQLSDITNQYRAIFDHSIDEDAPTEESAIVNAWTIEKVGEFLSLLQPRLREIMDGASLSELLSKAMYFGSYLGRVGVDFRSLLVPIFELVVQNLFKTNLATAQQTFATYLRKNRALAISKGLSTYSSAANIPKRDPLAPPLVLLDYPALAVLTNSILSALNELRKCCPLSLQYVVASDFEKFLMKTFEGLKQFKLELPPEDDEREAFQDLCKTCSEEMLPYLAKCLDSIFKSPRRMLQLEKLQDALSSMYEKRIAAATIDQLLQASPIEAPKVAMTETVPGTQPTVETPPLSDANTSNPS